MGVSWKSTPSAGGDAVRSMVKGVAERQAIDIDRQRAVKEKPHRQHALLVAPEGLGTEAEAFGLVEPGSSLARRDVRHRLGHRVMAGQVVRHEARGVQLPGM